VIFENLYFTRGTSVATELRCGNIFNNHVIAMFLRSVSVKEFWKSVNIWRRYGQKFGDVFWTTVYTVSKKNRTPMICLN